MRATTRVGASICLSIFSLVSIILLLPSSRIGTHLQKIALGSTLDELPGLWNWGTPEDEVDGEGIRLVVFGDSWVEDGEKQGKGKSWADVMCEEINCTSYVNYAEGQSPESYPSLEPTGVTTSNDIYVSSTANSASAIPAEPLLPDLAGQIQQFIALPPPALQPKKTMFLISFGVWDIYNAAGLDYALAQNVTDRTVDELFIQLNILYWHYSQNLSAGHVNSTDGTTHSPQPFQVVVPKVFDPTLLPGWISQRPVPLKPSSVAETQKNAVYLTLRWNNRVENALGYFIREPGVSPGEEQNTTNDNQAVFPDVEKDAFYYDLPEYLLKLIVEQQLQEEDLSDASGLGKGNSLFEDVYLSCVRPSDEGAEDGVVDLNGQLVCKKPQDYLFWDSFNIGSVAKEGIGKEIGSMVSQGKSLKSIWNHKKKL